MLILLNGRPGAGKLTIGRVLAERMGARLLDAHSLYNLAFALTDKGTPAFADTVRELRAIARARILDLPPDVPVILTDAKFADSAWGNELWDDTLAIAVERGVPFLVVVVECEPDENDRRLRSPERMGKRKPIDDTLLRVDRHERVLLRRDADGVLELDVTRLEPEEAAERIDAWVTEHEGEHSTDARGTIGETA